MKSENQKRLEAAPGRRGERKIIMKFADYKKACIKFAGDTKDWGNLDGYSHYTTTGDGWTESCDNDGGGIDVSWAFWKTGYDPANDARTFYEREYESMIRLAEDDEWDAEQRKVIKNLFEDMP